MKNKIMILFSVFTLGFGINGFYSIKHNQTQSQVETTVLAEKPQEENKTITKEETKEATKEETVKETKEATKEETVKETKEATKEETVKETKEATKEETVKETKEATTKKTENKTVINESNKITADSSKKEQDRKEVVVTEKEESGGIDEKCLTPQFKPIVIKPTNKPCDKPEQKPAEQPTVEPTEQPVEKPMVKPTNKPCDKPAFKPIIIKPFDKPIIKPTQKPIIKPTEKPDVKPDIKPEVKPTEKPQVKPDTDSSKFLASVEQEIFRIVNEERVANGVEPLAYNNTMQKYARIKSKDMAVNNYFAHEDLNGNLITVQMKKDGVFYRAWGENIAWMTSRNNLAQQFMTNWMNSQGHRKNILSTNFSSIGIGVYQIGNKIYATQEFYR